MIGELLTLKNILFSAFCFGTAIVAVDLRPAEAGTARQIIDSQCSIVNFTNGNAHQKNAMFAASVGVMTTNKSARAHLFRGNPNAGGSERCASQIAMSYCNKQYFNLVVTSLTSTMATNVGSRAFFTALDTAKTGNNPAQNSTGATLGILGAVTGGVAGAAMDGSVGGALSKGLIGGGAGLAAGGAIDAKRAHANCTSLQAKFSNLTNRMIQNGLRGQGRAGVLYRDIEVISARLGPQDAQLGQAMIAAMKDTVKRIKQSW